MLPACALLLPLPSRAGQWVITYSNSGKTSYDMIQPPTSLVNHTTNNAPTSSGANATTGSGIVDAQANASIVATLTWQPASGQTKTTDPPPTGPVSILETATASVSPGPWEGSGPAPYPAGTVDDGLQDAPITSSNGQGKVSTGSHLIQKDGSSGGITLDPVVMSAACPPTKFDSTGTPNWEQSISARVSLTVTLAKATLGAHSTVDTSAPGNPWNPALPRFFSGTNCSATASAAALSGYVSHAQLLVGGTAVKDYYDTNAASHPAAGPNVTVGTSQTTAALSVNFDSTHFADASPIDIQLNVTDTAGNTYTGKITGSAYNEGYVGYEPTTVSGQSNAQVVAAAMSACQTGDNSSTTDNRDAVLSAVKYNTDFFTCNHGNETPNASNHIYFEPPAGVGNSNGVIYANQSVDPSSTATSPRNDVAEAVATKKVNPPPYNFVYLDICNGALNTEFANGFGITSSSTDRAFIGWAGIVEDDNVNAAWTGQLYSFLQQGETLSQAAKDADLKITVDTNTGASCPHPIYGDANMTLHGTVYQGALGNWFK